jgi:hypothetical protein
MRPRISKSQSEIVLHGWWHHLIKQGVVKSIEGARTILSRRVYQVTLSEEHLLRGEVMHAQQTDVIWLPIRWPNSNRGMSPVDNGCGSIRCLICMPSPRTRTTTVVLASRVTSDWWTNFTKVLMQETKDVGILLRGGDILSSSVCQMDVDESEMDAQIKREPTFTSIFNKESNAPYSPKMVMFCIRPRFFFRLLKFDVFRRWLPRWFNIPCESTIKKLEKEIVAIFSNIVSPCCIA